MKTFFFQVKAKSEMSSFSGFWSGSQVYPGVSASGSHVHRCVPPGWCRRVHQEWGYFNMNAICTINNTALYKFLPTKLVFAPAWCHHFLFYLIQLDQGTFDKRCIAAFTTGPFSLCNHTTHLTRFDIAVWSPWNPLSLYKIVEQGVVLSAGLF